MILQDSTLYFKGFHLVLLKRTYWISLRPSEGSEVSQQSCSLSDSECVIAPAALCTPHILLSLPKLSDSPDFPVTQDGSLETHSLQLKDSMSYTAQEVLIFLKRNKDKVNTGKRKTLIKNNFEGDYKLPECIKKNTRKEIKCQFDIRFNSVTQLYLTLCGLQHARPPCPSPVPGIHPNSCPLSR